MTYTVADRIDSITYPSGARVDYGYGALGRVTGITWKSAPRATPVTVVASAAYLPFGPLRLLTFGNGSTLAKAYDQNYAIDAITSSIPAGLNLDFEVDVMGNITEISDSLAPPQPDRAYAYDPLYRLTEVTGSAGSLAEFTYSKTVDRLSAAGGGGIVGAYTYVAGTHHLGKAAGIARSYDANGNTASGISGFSFRYNDRNRLRVTYQPEDFGAWSYGYNGYGERVAKRHVAEGFAGPIELSDTRYVYNIDPTGLKSWFCARRVQNSPFTHAFLCNTLPDGSKDCSTQTPVPTCTFVDKALGLCDGDDGDDEFNPDQCFEVADNDCMDKCFLIKFAEPRPRYSAVGPFGTNCHEWTWDVLFDCFLECAF